MCWKLPFIHNICCRFVFCFFPGFSAAVQSSLQGCFGPPLCRIHLVNLCLAASFRSSEAKYMVLLLICFFVFFLTQELQYQRQRLGSCYSRGSGRRSYRQYVKLAFAKMNIGPLRSMAIKLLVYDSRYLFIYFIFNLFLSLFVS